MKGKILDSWADSSLGLTKIVKNTKYGTFSAAVVCHPQDMPHYSEWDGYRLCEYQCDLQALHEKIKWLKQRYIGMQQFFEVTEKDESVDGGVNLMYSLKRQIEKEEELYARLKDNYPIFADNLIKQREAFRKQISMRDE